MGRVCRALTFLSVLAVAAATLSAQPSRAVIVQTNAAGDNIHLIDPATNKVVGEITGIEVNHGAAAAPDGSRSLLHQRSRAPARRRGWAFAEGDRPCAVERPAQQSRDRQGRPLRLRRDRRRHRARWTSSTRAL